MYLFLTKPETLNLNRKHIGLVGTGILIDCVTSARGLAATATHLQGQSASSIIASYMKCHGT